MVLGIFVSFRHWLDTAEVLGMGMSDSAPMDEMVNRVSVLIWRDSVVRPRIHISAVVIRAEGRVHEVEILLGDLAACFLLAKIVLWCMVPSPLVGLKEILLEDGRAAKVTEDLESLVLMKIWGINEGVEKTFATEIAP